MDVVLLQDVPTLEPTVSDGKEHLLRLQFLSQAELEGLSEAKKKTLSSIKLDNFYQLEKNETTNTYHLIIWNNGYLFRKSAKLPAYPFFAMSLQPKEQGMITPQIEDLIQSFDLQQYDHKPDLLDHLAFALLHAGKEELALKAATMLCEKTPRSEKGWLRLGDIAFKSGMYKLAMLAYGRILHLSASSKANDYAVERVILCAEHTEFGHVFIPEEKGQIPESLATQLYEPWSPTVRQLFFDAYSKIQMSNIQPQEWASLSIPNNSEFATIPTFFRWLVPFQIALSSAPYHKSDIAALASPHIGIRHIISLTERSIYDEDSFRGLPIKQTQIVINDRYPPSIEQVDCIMEILSDPSNLPAMFHCAAGIGRTGTLGACYLVAFGFNSPNPDLEEPVMQATEAIDAVRAMRPGSIESTMQEDLVAKWASVIWKRRSSLREDSLEPPPCPLEVVGEVPSDANLLFFVGLQGSGKTWLSRALRARNLNGWKRVSQDESGSRARCETDLSRDPQGKRVILDRCNPSSADRKYWRGLAHWSSKPVIVWFDYPLTLCMARAQRRLDHPTLTPGPQVRTAISSTASQFETPVDWKAEGFGGMAIIRSFEAAKELVSLLSPPVHLYKFPRTAHLLDLGAATEDDLHSETFSRPSSSRPFSLDGESTLVITEKIDGANLGISLDSNGRIVIQNRSHWVNSKTHFQFKKLDLWIEEHREGLHRILAMDDTFPQRYVLFGEWMVCVHSIAYSKLPDQFLAFDLHDRTMDKFAAREVLEERLQDTGIHLVPVVAILKGSAELPTQMPTDDELRAMVQQPSRFYDGRVEGIYLKLERGGRVVERGKVVRGDFIAGNEHWTKGNLALNGISKDYSV